MAEFEAKITGIADLSKAKQDFDSFKRSMEQPIKITVDASGFNTVWGNLQKQVQSFGAQAGRQYTQGFEKNIAAIDTSKVANAMLKGIDNKITAKMGKGSLSLSIFGDSGLKELGASPAIFKTLEKELDSIKQKGLQIQSIKFNEDGTSFIAKAINDMGTLVTLTSRWKEAVAQTDKDGNFLGVNGGEWQTNIQYLTNFTSGAKQAQAEAKKLSSELDKVSQSFITGTFDANISKMEQGLSNISQSVGSDLVKKASDAAAEYYRITQEITNSITNPTSGNALQGEQLAKAYKDAESSLKTYNNAMIEVKSNTQQMLAEGVGTRNANQVESWAKKNSKALKQYGDQLDALAQKMREAKTQGELNDLNNQFKNLKAEAGSLGMVGMSFGDQLKKAFTRIGEFTYIYAFTSQLRQLPREMAQEVIKIDTAMTELRKVSTATTSELSKYFDQAADSAKAYGQTIDEVINSTASWTRLGYQLDDAKILTDVTAELAQVGSGLNVDKATEGLQATIRGFGLAADEAKRVGDMINYVADTEPIDAVGIIEGLERSSAVMRETNNSLEETIGLITATTSVTQDAASAGTAWRTVALRITGAKNELEEAGLETEGMVESTAKLRDEILAVAGVDILDATGRNFKSVTQIMRELAQVWDQLDEVQKNGLLDKIAGKRGAVAVSATLQNWDIVEDTIKGASTESVGSMDKQLEIYNQSIQASLDKFHVAFQELSADVINSDFIKGLVDIGTKIINIIDEIVKHTGVLGAAITGLGIAKTFSTIKNGASAVSDIGSAISLFTSGTIKDVNDTRTAFSLLWKEVASGAGGATSALGGMLSGVGAFLTSPVGLITAGVTAAIAGGALIYNHYKKQQEELRKQATATTEKWTGDKSNIETYKQQYEDLNEQLRNANLTESERIGIKQQLLDLQTQISEKYGADVGQLDLINGKYETQLSLISQIAEKEAHRNLQDNREAYQQAVNEMTKDRDYTMFSNGSESDLMKRVEWAYIRSGFKDQGDLSFKFTGDVTEADESIRELMDRLEALKETASETEKQFLDNVIGSASKLLTKNKEILDANQANYKAYLEQSLYDDGFGDELAEYSKRTQEYNDALLSGDTERIIAARKELNDYKGTVKEITDAHAEYGDFFDEVANSVLKTSEAVFDFKDIMDDGIADSSNSLSEYSDQIFRTVNEIKKLGLDGVDIQAILGDPKSAMYGDLSQLAKLWNPDIDLTKESDLKSVADFLMQMAYGADAVSGSVDLARGEFDDFMKSASASIDTLDKVNASLVNSFKSGGLSARIDAETGALSGDVATILNAYKKELGDGSIDDLFERTADGIIVNRDALRALQAQQENTTKAEFIERIKEAEAHLASASTEEERQAWQTRLDNVKLLASAYDGATSAYQKWLDAQKMGEAGDQYDTIASTAIKRGEELYDKGLVGTNEFRAIAQLYSDEDLALASIDEITEAYENGVDTVKKYFTEGQEGAVAFADKLVELGAATKEGDFYNFEDGINTAQIADELDISVDLVEAAFKKLGDYGFNIHFMNEDQIAEFDTLTEKAEEAQDKLKELRDSGAEVGDTNLIDIDLGEIDTVDEMKSALDQLNEVVASPDIDPESAEAYQAIIDSLQQKLDLLSQTDIGNEVNFTNLDNAYTLLGSLQGRIDSINGINATSSIDIDVTGDDEVQLVAEQIANLPPDIKTAIGFDVEDDATAVIEKLQNEKVQIPVEYQQPTNTPNATGTATVSVQYEQGDLPSISSQTVQLDYEPNPIEANVVAKLDNTAVESYTPVSKDADVVYGVDDTAPTNYQPSDKSATVTYDVSVNGASAVYNLPDSGSRTITYHIETVGSPPGNYKGTVPRSAFQGMAHVRGTAHASGFSKYGLKQNENSLINELGAEIVVRPSEDSWMIFNDGMPTFASLRKDDIIFNADQTKELLEKGWTKNYASILGGAFASGTIKGSAHARKVTGGGSFKKAKSSSSGGGGGNGGGGGGSDGGGSSESKEDAKEFNEILDEIQINIDRIERDIKNLDTIASDTFTNLTGRTNALNRELVKVRKEIKVQQTGYSRYLAKANSVGLNGDWAARVRNGENLTIDDVGDEELWDKISEYKKWYELAIDCRDAIFQLKVDEAELWNQRFDVRKTDFENQIEQIQHAYELLDSFIEKAENTGRITSNTLRLRQLDQERSKVTKLQSEYKALEDVMAQALRSGEITKNSEGYYKMLNSLNEIRESIAEATSNIEKLNKEIRETDWEIFDRALEKIENINDELEFLYDILGDEDKFYDDNGRVTNEGISAFGILSAQYNVAMQEAQKYADEIRKINQDIAKDPYNQDLIERRDELRKSQRDAIEDAEKYKDSIVDLVENGIKAQIDAMKELIDQYTDLLDAEKEEHDYAKKVSSAQDNINKLQKQLNAYANDDSEEGMSRRQKLMSNLKNAQESLAETEEDRRISQTKKLLSDLEQEYEDILNARLDNIDNLIQAVVSGVDANASLIRDAITTAAQDVGYTLSENTSIIFNNASDSKNLASYFTNGGFVEKVTSIADSVKSIDTYIQNAIKNADQTQSTNVSKEDSTVTSTQNTLNNAAQVGSRARNNANKISGVDGNWSKVGNNWQWTFNDGEKATGWSQIDSKWYSFDNNGRMRANEWIKDSNGKYYHLGSTGAMDTNKWVGKGKTWGYVGNDGAASTGWKYLKWSGGNDWFYFNGNGDMLTGLQTIGGKKYYMDGKNGNMISNKWINAGGKWYYMDSTGAATTGWKYLKWSGGNDWFYFNSGGEMTTGMQNIGGNMYYMKPKDGTMAKNEWINYKGKWYYMGDSGAAAKGWNYLKWGSNKDWYYFNNDGSMKKSEWFYDPYYGAWYWFTDSGAMARDGKYKTKDGMKWFDANGKWKGYKSGTQSVGASGLYWTNEGMPETIIRKSDGAILTRLNSGDTVFNGDATKTMWDFANNPQKFLRGMGISNTYGSGNNVNLEFNLSGLRSPTEFMNALRRDKQFERFIQEITIGRVNGHGSLAKNAIKF